MNNYAREHARDESAKADSLPCSIKSCSAERYPEEHAGNHAGRIGLSQDAPGQMREPVDENYSGEAQGQPAHRRRLAKYQNAPDHQEPSQAVYVYELGGRHARAVESSRPSIKALAAEIFFGRMNQVRGRKEPCPILEQATPCR